MGQCRVLEVSGAVFALWAAPCSGQQTSLQEDILRALAHARPALTAHLKASVRQATRPGELALLCLAGLHDELSVSDPALGAALARLAKAKPSETYDLALRLTVLEAWPEFPGRMKLAKQDLRKLLRHRSPEGAFQYRERPSTWDLSNTQYGALGLRAAVGMGLKVPREVWTKLARTIGSNQARSGGFDYSRVRTGTAGYPSMTVAGIAVLAICRQALGDGDARGRKLDAQVARAWSWLAQKRAAIGSNKQRWPLYFHYGLERAAILCDVALVGDEVDWYAQGARMLIDAQRAGGGWSSSQDAYPGSHLSDGRGDSVPTAFAVLFLRRKFKKVAGPLTARVVRLVNIGPRSKQSDVEACAEQLVAQGKAAMPSVVKAMLSDVAPRRRVAAIALPLITGSSFGFDADGDRSANRAAVRRAELWFLKNR